MTQGQLNLQPEPDLLPGARRTDPVSSWEAYQDAMASGAVKDRCKAIMATAGIHQKIGSTYRELYEALKFMRRGDGSRMFREPAEVARRLNTLERLNFVEKIGTKRCLVTGRRMSAWRRV